MVALRIIRYTERKFLSRKGLNLLDSHINSAKRKSSGCAPCAPPTFKYCELEVKLACPSDLQPKPDVASLQFGKLFTDHMLTIEYLEKLGGWQKPQIVPFQNLSLHPAAKCLHYAVELFEGLKAYRDCYGSIRLFRPEKNMNRMNGSAARSSLPRFDNLELIKCFSRLVQVDQEWVPHSESSSLYIRPTLIGTDGSLGVAISEAALLYVILSPVGAYFSSGFTPIKLLADPQFTRSCYGGAGDRKLGSNYGPTIDVQRHANELGYHQVLWLHGDNDLVTEVGTMNLFIFCKNKEGQCELITPELDGLILPGITRMSILELTREWNEFKVTERKIYMAELVEMATEKRLLEVFGAGTACIVSPVESLNYKGNIIKVPDKDPRTTLYQRLEKALTDIQYGRVPHCWSKTIDEWLCC